MTLPPRTYALSLIATLSAAAPIGIATAGEIVEVASRTADFPAGTAFARVFSAWNDELTLSGQPIAVEELRSRIVSAADRHQIPPSLVLAIVRNGSGFDPAARSKAGAVGLMALSRQTAALAARFLTKDNYRPTTQELVNPKININLGTAALHVLMHKTFSRIKNPVSRRYVVLAAYQAGVKGVVQALAGSRRTAIAISRANRLSPGSVYRRLMQRLPYKESKIFLAEVTADMRRWEHTRQTTKVARYFAPNLSTPVPTVASLAAELPMTPLAIARKALPRQVQSTPSSQRLEIAALDSDLEVYPQPIAPPVPIVRLPRTPVVPLAIASLSGAVNKVASRFSEPVLSAARRYAIRPSVILSMMKNESAFDPKAVSHAGALGLMQLVPKDGGREALSFLLGRDETPSRAVLLRLSANIEMGTAYLHILMSRYLRNVEDDTTRLYAAVAAYNTGLSNVARALLGRRNISGAVARMNEMSSDEVYRALMKQLPYGETKLYLARVRRDMALFTEWDSFV